jgi:hypothetical protein
MIFKRVSDRIRCFSRPSLPGMSSGEKPLKAFIKKTDESFDGTGFKW